MKVNFLFSCHYSITKYSFLIHNKKNSTRFVILISHYMFTEKHWLGQGIILLAPLLRTVKTYTILSPSHLWLPRELCKSYSACQKASCVLSVSKYWHSSMQRGGNPARAQIKEAGALMVMISWQESGNLKKSELMIANHCNCWLLPLPVCPPVAATVWIHTNLSLMGTCWRFLPLTLFQSAG